MGQRYIFVILRREKYFLHKSWKLSMASQKSESCDMKILNTSRTRDAIEKRAGKGSFASGL